MTKLILGLMLMAGAAFAQPTVTRYQTGCLTGSGASQAFTVGCTKPTTAIVQVTANPTSSYVYVQYGVAPGPPYPFATYDEQCNILGTSTFCSFSITGLAEGTTYYMRAVARPNPNDDVGACRTNGCGATEFTYTTASTPAPHLPTLPSAVPPNMTTYPATTGTDPGSGLPYYKTITLTGSGTNECTAASTVTGPAPGTGAYAWTVTAGDTLTKILTPTASGGDGVQFGTIIEVPEGLTCIVPPGAANRGYSLPELAVDPLATGSSIDAANHRWLIIRTHQNVVTDFPPFGTRMDPAYTSKLGSFQANTPTSSALGSGGQVFQTANSGAGITHHIWKSNIRETVDQTQSGAEWDTLDFYGYSGLAFAYLPDYIVNERVYYNGPQKVHPTDVHPFIFGDSMYSVNRYAIYGNYFDGLQSGISESTYPSLEPAIFTEQPIIGPLLVDNNMVCCGSGLGILFQILAPSTGPATNFPNDITVTHNTVFFPPSVVLTYQQQFQAGLGQMCRNGIEMKGAFRYNVSDNWMNGSAACVNNGQAIMIASTTESVTATNNYFYNTAGVFGNTGVTNGNNDIPIQLVGDRSWFANNLAWNIGRNSTRQAGAQSATTEYMLMNSVADNMAISQNTFDYQDFGCDSTITPVICYGDFDPFIVDITAMTGATTNALFKRNVYAISNNGNVGSGGINVQFNGGGNSNNEGFSHPGLPTALQSPTGNYATTWGQVAGSIDGSVGLGMSGYITLAGGTGYSNGASLTITGCTGTTGNVSPYGGTSGGVIIYSQGLATGVCNPATMTATPTGGSGGSLLPGYSARPNYTWTGNVGIGGKVGSGYPPVDMTQAQLNAVSALMPGNDVYPTGSTLTARMQSAGYPAYGTGDWNCTPTAQSSCSAGANIPALENGLGLVRNISVVAGDTYIVANYTAPDSRVCSVDAVNGSNGYRVTDSGVAQVRSTVLSGLTAGTSYSYKIHCYFDQTIGSSPFVLSGISNPGWLLFPSEYTNIQTDGVITTSASVSRSVSIGYTLPTGATQATVLETPAIGSPVSNTCTVTPCALTLPTGVYAQQITFKTTGGATVMVSNESLTVQ